VLKFKYMTKEIPKTYEPKKVEKKYMTFGKRVNFLCLKTGASRLW